MAALESFVSGSVWPVLGGSCAIVNPFDNTELRVPRGNSLRGSRRYVRLGATRRCSVLRGACGSELGLACHYQATSLA